MRDLDDVLNGGLDARERELARLAPSDAGLDRLLRGVRRHRARRHALQGVAAAAAGALLVTVGWWNLTRDTPGPAVTPTVLPSPTHAPTAASSTPSVASPVAVPGLPPMEQATPELVTSATPGWLLVTYDAPVGPDVLLLVSPTGERYRLLDLPVGADLSVDRWQAGSTQADVSYWNSGEPMARQVWARLDLLSGALTQGPEFDVIAQPAWFTPDGRRVILEPADAPESVRLVSFDGTSTTVAEGIQVPNGAGWLSGQQLLDPTGTRVFVQPWGDADGAEGSVPLDEYAIVDLVSGGLSWRSFGVAAQMCNPVGWFDATTLLVVCQDAGGTFSAVPGADRHPTLYRVWVTGSTPPSLLGRLTDGDPVPFGSGVPTLEGIWSGASAVGGTGSPDGVPDDGTWRWGASPGEIVQTVPASSDVFSPTAAAGSSVYGTCFPRGRADARARGLCAVAGAVTTMLVPLSDGDSGGVRSSVAGS